MTENDVSEKNTERLISSAGPEVNIPAARKTAIVERLAGKPAQEQKPIWRIITRSRIMRIAAAAVIIMAVMIFMKQFGHSMDGAAVAFGQVTSAVKKICSIWTGNKRREKDALGSYFRHVRSYTEQPGTVYLASASNQGGKNTRWSGVLVGLSQAATESI
ncbi:MAG: hypothetical protein ACYTEQ_09690 [Planctomycetota bacterium]